VADLLDLSRLEAKPEADEEVVLDLLVREEVESLSDRAREAEIKLLVELSPVIVRGSNSDLGLAVRNLIDNALRHTPAGGEVKVVVERSHGRASVHVIDNGEGIASREVTRIFERFYRVDSARSRATGGTGLGLAIVRHVAESHGGTVDVRSSLGQGSTFSINLPTAMPDRHPS
jgi:signal transduction histidine kinase